MRLRRTGGRTGHRLDPVRWPATIRRGVLLRAVAVVVLLATAAGLLYSGAQPGCTWR